MKPCPSHSASASILVVGAGPAGLMAAISAAEAGARVIVCEQLSEAGKKLLATGGGRCNFTNTLAREEFIRRYGAKSRFAAPALKAFDGKRLCRFLDELGVHSRAADGFHVFPTCDSALPLRNALMRVCRHLGVQFRFNCRAESILLERNSVAGLAATRGIEPGAGVILAAGGAGYPELGGGESGYRLARGAGHAVVTPCPALVPLITRESWPGTLSGVTLGNVSIKLPGSVNESAGARGGLLFTQRGISGPAALDISGRAAEALRTCGAVTVALDLCPGTEMNDYLAYIGAWRGKHGAKTVLSLLGSQIPAALAKNLLTLAHIPTDTRIAQLAREDQRRLATLVKSTKLTITGTEGFGKAMVTRGGVALEEIHPKTLESRIVRGLFFAGEIMDIDGPCGGFNLQWAFSSGRLAGLSAAQYAKNVA